MNTLWVTSMHKIWKKWISFFRFHSFLISKIFSIQSKRIKMETLYKMKEIHFRSISFHCIWTMHYLDLNEIFVLQSKYTYFYFIFLDSVLWLFTFYFYLYIIFSKAIVFLKCKIECNCLIYIDLNIAEGNQLLRAELEESIMLQNKLFHIFLRASIPAFCLEATWKMKKQYKNEYSI